MRISLSQTIEVAREPLFAWSQDYTQRLAWDVFLSKAYLLGHVPANVGVDAFCQSRSGATMVSRYISYRPGEE